MYNQELARRTSTDSDGKRMGAYDNPLETIVWNIHKYTEINVLYNM